MCIVYTLYEHALVDFDEQIANYIMSPFYNDHTVYGAMLAMFFPVLLFFTMNKKYSFSIRFAAVMVLIIYTFGLVFSYTRAAWVSLIVAIAAYICLLLHIKFRTLLIAFCGLVAVAHESRETDLRALLFVCRSGRLRGHRRATGC